MGSFFHGWRRKLGVMTLVIACVFMGGWVRSRLVSDYVTLSTKAYPLITISSRLGLLESSWFDEKLELKFKFGWSVTPLTAKSKANPKSNLLYWWDKPDINSGGRVLNYGTSFSIQYCVIVIPLTLISAFLLLSKPRNSTQKKIVEPVPDDGK